MRSKRFCVLPFILVVGLISAASAQTDWKGFYIGANVGGNLSRTDATTTTVFSPTGYFAITSVPAIAALSPQHPDSNGFVGGGQAGYNFQSGALVFGLEADIGAMTGSDTRTSTGVYPCCAPTTFTVAQRMEHSWLFTARPRVGFTAGRALFYVTGGLAVTNFNYRELFTDTFATANESAVIDETKAGWTAGGGLEYQVHQHWSVKGEYLYADFGDERVTSTNLTAFTPPIAFPVNVFTHRADLRNHIFRFGVNYRF